MKSNGIPDHIYDINNLLELHKVFSLLMNVRSNEDNKIEIISFDNDITFNISKNEIKEIHLIKISNDSKEFIPKSILSEMQNVLSGNLDNRFKIAMYTTCIGKIALLIGILCLLGYFHKEKDKRNPLFELYLKVFNKFTFSAMGLDKLILKWILGNSKSTTIPLDINSLSKFIAKKNILESNRYSLEFLFAIGVKLLLVGTFGLIKFKELKEQNIQIDVFKINNINDLEKVIYGYMNLEDKVKNPIGVGAEEVKRKTFTYVSNYLKDDSDTNCDKLVFLIEYVLNFNIKLKKVGLNSDQSTIIKMGNYFVQYKNKIKETLGIPAKKLGHNLSDSRLISKIPSKENYSKKINEFILTNTDAEYGILKKNVFMQNIVENQKLNFNIVSYPDKEDYFKNYGKGEELLFESVNSFINLLIKIKESVFNIDFNNFVIYEFLMDLIIFCKKIGDDKVKEREFLLGSLIEFNYSIFNDANIKKFIKQCDTNFSKKFAVNELIDHYKEILKNINRRGFYWIYKGRFSGPENYDLFYSNTIPLRYVEDLKKDKDNEVLNLLELKGNFKSENLKIVNKVKFFNASSAIEDKIKNKILSNYFTINDFSKLSNSQLRCLGGYYTSIISNPESNFTDYSILCKAKVKMSNNINWDEIFPNATSKDLHSNNIEGIEAEKDPLLASNDIEEGDDSDGDSVSDYMGEDTMNEIKEASSSSDDKKSKDDEKEDEKDSKKLSEIFSDGGLVFSDKYSEIALSENIKYILSKVESNIDKLTDLNNNSSIDGSKGALITSVLSLLVGIKKSLETLKLSVSFESSDKIVILMEFIMKAYELISKDILIFFQKEKKKEA